MTIKQNGGVFGRNPTFNDVTIEGQLTFDGDIDINSDLKVNGNLEVSGDVDITSTAVNPLAVVGTNASGAFASFNNGTQTSLFAGFGSTLMSGATSSDAVLRYDSNDNLYIARGSAKVATFNSAGSLEIANGSVVISAAGGGIDFSATSGTGTSELFDDYEEGTWTPTTASDASGAFSTAEGVYTKIGRLVFIEMYVVISSNFASNTIGGLPFAVGNLLAGTSFGQSGVVLTNAADTVTGAAQETTSNIRLYNDHNTLSAHSPNTTNDGYRLALCYQV